MDSLMQPMAENTITWLMLTSIVGILSGFLSSLLIFQFVTKKEIDARIEREEKRNKDERIRQEIIRWANPILDSVNSLRGRLDNILYSAGYLALDPDYKNLTNPDWSITYDYFMNSSLYLFGQYFAWIRMMRLQLNFELFETQDEKDEFFEATRKVYKSLSSFPQRPHCPGPDAQVFGLQQRSIGELFMDNETNCIGYPEFLSRMEDHEFNMHMQPLRSLLECVSPDKVCRWQRLNATHRTLVDLAELCEKLLSQQQHK